MRLAILSTASVLTVWALAATAPLLLLLAIAAGGPILGYLLGCEVGRDQAARFRTAPIRDPREVHQR
jgi:hypothetical protein